MLNKLKNFFNDKKAPKDDEDQNLELLCGLMVEAANSDEVIDDNEIQKINSILVNTFMENSNDVNLKLNKAIQNRNNSKSLYYYTSKINKNYTEEKKILLIETLWEVVLSDGKVHDFESSLIRRLAGLLYISDVNSGKARQKALNKNSNK